MHRKLALVVAVVASLAACSGGGSGSQGPTGPTGPAGCDGAPAGQGQAFTARLTASTPGNGAYFVPGERVQLSLSVVDRCDRPVDAADLGTLSLYLAGPRAGALTRTATRLLNCVTDRNAPDHQHHFVNLLAPAFVDATQHNLSGAGTSLVFTTAPVSDEAAGTYTAGLWVKSLDGAQQELVLAELQIGTATAEAYATGDSSSCDACHRGTASGRSELAHGVPSAFAPAGNAALDQAPVASCKLCHNADGQSPISIVRKVHGIHRGPDQLDPGVAHPEYGAPADATLASYASEPFPSMPGAERDCARCHVGGSELSAPGRLACGSCHDNLFFDTGTLTPPRSFGKPAAGSCTQDADCTGYSTLAACDTGSGTCQLAQHPPQADDTQCLSCHAATGGPSPLDVAHDISQRTHAYPFTLSDLAVAGATGASGAFLVGDVPVVSFRMLDGSGAPIADLATNASWAAFVIIAGPDDDPQRVWPLSNVKPLLTYLSGTYRVTFPSGWPALAQPPLDVQDGSAGQVNAPGSYTLWLYVVRTSQASPNPRKLPAWRTTANVSRVLRFGTSGPAQARQVITAAGCNACHVVTQAHGGSRTDPTTCFTCHTRGAVDQNALGTVGVACTAATEATACAGFAQGYEACVDTNADGVADSCKIIDDPTPNQSIELSVLMHQVHVARDLAGWAERGNLTNPGKLQVDRTDLSADLLTQDPRNCTRCHGDAGGTCTALQPCGIGQACQGGTCVNVSYTSPSARTCLSCHDSASAFAHAQLNTYADPSGPIESCPTCHGPDAAFAVKAVHAL